MKAGRWAGWCSAGWRWRAGSSWSGRAGRRAPAPITRNHLLGELYASACLVLLTLGTAAMVAGLVGPAA